MGFPLMLNIEQYQSPHACEFLFSFPPNSVSLLKNVKNRQTDGHKSRHSYISLSHLSESEKN